MGDHGIAAVIFDLDGTLLDTEFVSERALQRIVAAHGRVLPWDLRKRILGRPSTEWTRMVIDELALYDHITPNAMATMWEQHMEAMVDEMKAMPGALQILQMFADNGIPMALATSSTSAAVAMKRRHHEALFQHFHVIVCGDDPDVKHGKPAPDIFQIAAHRLLGATNGGRILVFEDSVLGITAAKAAGFHAIAIPDVRIHDTDEERRRLFPHADCILPSLVAATTGTLLSQTKD